MRKIYLILIVIIPCLVKAQEADTTKIKSEIDSLIKVCRLLTGQQKFEEAIKIIDIGKIKAKAVFGRNSAIYASCVFNMGRTYYISQDYTQAEQLYLEAKAIRENVIGREHAYYARSLNNLANLYRELGIYEKAEPLFLDAIAIREKVLGKEHLDYAWSLNDLAVLYVDLGDYQKAEFLYIEAKDIWEKVFGKGHPEYASSLNNLANLYKRIGKYEEALPMLIEAKSIREKVLGKEDTDYFSSLNNLAVLYFNLGIYDKAEALYLEAKSIVEKVLGKDQLIYAIILNNLANLYSEMGNYDKGILLHIEANALREKLQGKENSNYADNLMNLAILYDKIGNYNKAETIYLDAINILEKVFGKDNPDGAKLLIHLASLYMKMDNYKKAETICFEAKSILEISLRKDHPDYAFCLQNLSVLYQHNGNFEKAESLNIEAKNIYEKLLGNESPDYKSCLINLAEIYFEMGNYEKAEPLFTEIASLNQRMISKAVHHLSERELNEYLNQFLVSQDKILTFANLSKYKKSVQICYDNSLFYKGFLLNTSNQIKKLSLSGSTTIAKFNLLKSDERRLAREYSKAIAERKDIEALETNYNELQKELASEVAGYSEAIQQIKWTDVKQKISANEATIEFVHFKYTKNKTTDSIIYSALVLLQGDTSPQYVTLFEEKELKNLLEISNIRRKEFVSNLYQSSTDILLPISPANTKSLYELIWKPLESKLIGIKTIYFSPSGLLHQINQNAIAINEKTLLSDKYNLIQMGSTRELVFRNEDSKQLPKTACLIGGVNFDMDSTEMIAAHQIMDSNSIAIRSELSFSYLDTSLRGGSFKYLMGSEKEIIDIQQIFNKANINATSYHGNGATEEAFKKLGDYNSTSPQIIHISTHGFFFPDPKNSHQSSGLSNQEPVFKISEHPMIRSGLLLAGANQTWKTGKALRPEMEDGILTAYEISQLNLRNTELVVLSACETGLGEIQGNEGVYGLQRAFKIAGVKNLIMSLWQVPDKETAELMALFYKNWLIKKMSIRESLLAAQNVLRDRGLTPFYWAGFVLVE